MKVVRVVSIALIVMFSTVSMNAQVAVTVSKNKTKIDGNTFYLHIVRQGETLYSISKAYKVLQKDVVINNPAAIDAIRVGEELYIPEKSGVSRFKGKPMESAQFIYHIAKEGETVVDIMRKYNVTVDELYTNNPALEHAPLQTGQVVSIPKKNAEPPKTQPGFTIHKVKRGETLFSIARDHDINVNRLAEANPKLGDGKLSIGQEVKIPLPDVEPLRIPVATAQADTIFVSKDIPAADSSLSATDSSGLATDSMPCVNPEPREFIIAMLLPFSLSNMSAPADTSLKQDGNGNYIKSDGSVWLPTHSETALEFYQGALLAVDSLRQLGFSAHLMIYDCSRDTLTVDHILAKPEMRDADLIIGPFLTNQVNRVAQFASEHRIFFVSPVAMNIESVRQCPYLIQVNSGEINTVAPVTSFIAQNNKEPYRVVLISNKSETDQSLFQAYRNKLGEVMPDSMVTALEFTTAAMTSPHEYLKPGIKNIVIVTAVDEGFITMVAGGLNAMAHKFQIELYGLSICTKFVNLDPEYLHLLDFHYATPWFVDYNDPRVKRYLSLFRSYYYTEPHSGRRTQSVMSPMQYAFLGFDVMYYFGSLLQQHGRTFGSCLPQFTLPTLQSSFRFNRVAHDAGFLNTSVDICHYTRQYTIEREQPAEKQ